MIAGNVDDSFTCDPRKNVPISWWSWNKISLRRWYLHESTVPVNLIKSGYTAMRSKEKLKIPRRRNPEKEKDNNVPPFIKEDPNEVPICFSYVVLLASQNGWTFVHLLFSHILCLFWKVKGTKPLIFQLCPSLLIKKWLRGIFEKL